MRLFNFEFNNLNDLFMEMLQDTYDAEIRLTSALPKMAGATTAPDLKTCFNDHLTETNVHVQRLEDIFRRCGWEPKRETCHAMKGLIGEGNEMINADGDPHVRDAALIAAAQKVEHYEISAYGTLRTFANHLGMADVATILQQTLDEESKADERLTEIAEMHINQMAAH